MTSRQISSELSKRIVTGVLGGAALLLLIIFGGWPGITVFTAFMSLGMLYEYSNMTLVLADHSEKRYFLLFLGWLLFIVQAVAPQMTYGALDFGFLAIFTYYLGISPRHAGVDLRDHFVELAASLFGLVYLVFFPGFLITIHQLPYGVAWTVVFLLINWVGDSAAYFVGKRYGRKKLFPAISPKKTVAGAVGGLGFGLIATLIFGSIWTLGPSAGGGSVSYFGLTVTALTVGVIAQIGDLCESLIKRAFERKDSGTILPGHGGFLDRFDGVVFSAPVMYACIRIFA